MSNGKAYFTSFVSKCASCVQTRDNCECFLADEFLEDTQGANLEIAELEKLVSGGQYE